MKHRSLLIVILLIIGVKSFSQTMIKGYVVDSADQQPVAYTVIGVYTAGDSKPLTGALSDSTGTFILSGIKPGFYDLKIEFLGYRSKTIEKIKVSTDPILDLGKIKLSAVANLAEVIVTGQQNTASNKIDKQIYKADQFQTAKGGNAIDIIKNMPAVSVNTEGEIRLRGATGFLLLLNGKPVSGDVTTVLSQIPSNSIENVEIITAPSAKYDADGKSGIINITTKKGSGDGLSYIINTQIGLPSVNSFHNKAEPQRYGTDILLNYKKNKWDLSAGASYQENDLAGRREGNANTTIDNRYTSFPSLGERSFQRRTYAVRANLSYTVNKNDIISAGIYYGERRQYRRADIFYNNTKTDIYTKAPLGSVDYFNSNLQKKQGNFALVNAEYAHTFKNKSTLSFSGIYEYAVLDGFTKNLNTNHEEHNDTLQYTLNTANSPLDGLRIKTDYSIAIGKGKLESGYQFRYQNQTGNYTYQEAILGTPDYLLIPDFSADIKVTNSIQAAYVQYSSKQGELEYLGGLRYEYATREFNSDKQQVPYYLTLSNFFPSANLLYHFKNNLKLKTGFSRRVQRSNSNELNPYPEREHSETLEQGDPQILPEFVNLTELGLIKDLKKGSAFISVYNQQIQHVVNRVNSAYNDTILNRIYTNAGNAQVWGVEATLTLTPVKWWDFFLSGNVYNYQIRGTLFNNAVTVKNGGIAYSISTNQAIQFTKTWSTQFNLNYLSLRPTAIGEDSRFISPNISIKKTFFNNALSVVLLWQNLSCGLIKSNEQRITTWGSNFYTTTNYIQEKDVVWINLSYQFKQSTKKLKLPSSEFGEKEF